MSQRELSCGIFVESPAGVLLAHATGTPRWDLPKGRCEPGEAPIEAALRECREETGLDFEAERTRLVDLGQHSYLRKKDLHLFTCAWIRYWIFRCVFVPRRSNVSMVAKFLKPMILPGCHVQKSLSALVKA